MFWTSPEPLKSVSFKKTPQWKEKVLKQSQVETAGYQE